MKALVFNVVFTAAAVVLLSVALVPGAVAESSESKPAGDLEPIKIELPEPFFGGTPLDYWGPNLEPEDYKDRPPYLAPKGTAIVSKGKPVTSSDKSPSLGELSQITDGNKDYAKSSLVELDAGAQWVQIDLEQEQDIYAVLVWHFHEGKRVYFDMVVKLANDPEFKDGVVDIYNNDHDNSAGLGVGKDKEYIENNKGRLIKLPEGKRARYLRLYTKGNTANELNHYVEVEVFGKPAGEAAAAVDDRDDRMGWWREARFGMFIHWGLYAIPAGTWKGKQVPGIGEWIMHRGEIPVADYEPLTKQFNPVKFDANEWARIAADAGMKYLVITSKHHDGFCLWDSEVGDYDVIDQTPFKRDILGELHEACNAHGVKLCFYHSIMDWHHPDYLPRRKWEKRSAEGADLQRYITYMKAQLKELITKYDPPVLWFDGEWEETWTHEDGVKLYDYVRSLKPDIIINNRVDKGRQGMQGMTKEGSYRGDFGTPEQEIPDTGLEGVDWESCMTMNDTWGFKSYDHNWKSTEELIQNIVDIASKGGNYLLNVGPKANGLFPEPSVQRLAAIGDWMEKNSESIYGTTASPFGKLPWGRCTAKPGKLYLHVFDWPKDGKLELKGIADKVKSAALLAGMKDSTLDFEQQGKKLTIAVPPGLDSADTVVVLGL